MHDYPTYASRKVALCSLLIWIGCIMCTIVPLTSMSCLHLSEITRPQEWYTCPATHARDAPSQIQVLSEIVPAAMHLNGSRPIWFISKLIVD